MITATLQEFKKKHAKEESEANEFHAAVQARSGSSTGGGGKPPGSAGGGGAPPGSGGKAAGKAAVDAKKLNVDSSKPFLPKMVPTSIWHEVASGRIRTSIIIDGTKETWSYPTGLDGIGTACKNCLLWSWNKICEKMPDVEMPYDFGKK